MAAIDSADVITELNAQWNVGVIAKPTFIDEFEEGKKIKSRSTIVYWKVLNYIPASTGTGIVDNGITSIDIDIVEESKANAQLSLGEVRRILNVKTSANAQLHVDQMIPRKEGKLYVFRCKVREVYFNQ
jgi:hypothetical protein